MIALCITLSHRTIFFCSAKELRDTAKKKKSGSKNKGYQSCFEHFSVQDEQILGKCCSEVSKSLEDIFSQRERRSKAETQAGDQEDNVVLVSDEEGITPLKNHGLSKPAPTTRDGKDQRSVGESTETDSMSYAPEPPPRRPSSLRRRSSVGQLAHFVKRNSVDDNDAAAASHDMQSATHSKGIGEAVLKFQFRSHDPEKIQHREMERRQGDPEYVLAQTKRKRMAEYVQQKG